MLQFLGIGSAFNTTLGNTSAYYKLGDVLILVDAGGMIFHTLLSKGLLKDIRKIDILITHMHPDHVGSLGDLIFYAYYSMHHDSTFDKEAAIGLGFKVAEF